MLDGDKGKFMTITLKFYIIVYKSYNTSLDQNNTKNK